MARRRRSRNYKIVNAQTQDVGSAGAQISVLEITPIDPNIRYGWLNNIQVTCLLNDSPEGEVGGFVAYLASSSTFSDDAIITARGGNFSDTVNLTAKRRVTSDASVAVPDGKVWLFVELTDITPVTDVTLRVITETWGKYLKTSEL